MVFLIHNELRRTVNHTSDLHYYVTVTSTLFNTGVYNYCLILTYSYLAVCQPFSHHNPISKYLLIDFPTPNKLTTANSEASTEVQSKLLVAKKQRFTFNFKGVRSTKNAGATIQSTNGWERTSTFVTNKSRSFVPFIRTCLLQAMLEFWYGIITRPTTEIVLTLTCFLH